MHWLVVVCAVRRVRKWIRELVVLWWGRDRSRARGHEGLIARRHSVIGSRWALAQAVPMQDLQGLDEANVMVVCKQDDCVALVVLRTAQPDPAAESDAEGVAEL